MKDIYIKFEGGSELQGDSSDAKHANEIEISSFVHRIVQPKSSSASSAGGFTAERTEHGEMHFTKDIDKSTSKLLRACSAGTVYPKATVTFYRAYGGKGSTGTSQSRVDYFKIVLEDVVVASVDMCVGQGELPAETFGLKYGKVVWEYKQHKSDGSSTSTGPAGWDLRKKRRDLTRPRSVRPRRTSMQTFFSPSLLDKLLGAGSSARHATTARHSIEQVKDSVGRDIEMFLNAHRMHSPDDLAEFPNVARSVLTLGLVDIAPMSLASDNDRQRITEAIRSGLMAHDRRLSGVEVGVREAPAPARRLVFTIRARLRLQAGAEQVVFDAVLHPGSKRYDVSKADRRAADASV